MQQFKMPSYMDFHTEPTELVPVVPKDNFDVALSWLNIFIRSNPTVLVGYEDQGNFVEIKALQNKPGKFIEVSVVDLDNREVKRRIPKGTIFSIYLCTG